MEVVRCSEVFAELRLEDTALGPRVEEQAPGRVDMVPRPARRGEPNGEIEPRESIVGRARIAAPPSHDAEVPRFGARKRPRGREVDRMSANIGGGDEISHSSRPPAS